MDVMGIVGTRGLMVVMDVIVCFVMIGMVGS